MLNRHFYLSPPKWTQFEIPEFLYLRRVVLYIPAGVGSVHFIMAYSYDIEDYVTVWLRDEPVMEGCEAAILSAELDVSRNGSLSRACITKIYRLGGYHRLINKVGSRTPNYCSLVWEGRQNFLPRFATISLVLDTEGHKTSVMITAVQLRISLNKFIVLSFGKVANIFCPAVPISRSC